MELRTLPLDGLRPILSWVDLPSLVKLFATFDRSIQTLLSSPGAFALLHITPTKAVARAPLRYFLTSVRNVSTLKFEQDTKWAAPTLSLLQTLNPRHLFLKQGFLHESVADLLIDWFAHPKDPELCRLTQNLASSGLPDFARLTPRLETLEMNHSMLIAPQVAPNKPKEVLMEVPFSLPPTIEILKLSGQYSPILSSIPPTIRKLRIKAWDVDFSLLLSRFQCLEELSIDLSYPPDLAQDALFPASLQKLKLQGTVDSVLAFLDHPSLRKSKLLDLTLKIGALVKRSERPPLSLAAVLPESLVSLSIMLKDGLYSVFSSLPPCISRLTLNLERILANIDTSLEIQDRPSYSLTTLLHGLTSLEYLHLTVGCAISGAKLEDVTDQRELPFTIHRVVSSLPVLPLRALSSKLKELYIFGIMDPHITSEDVSAFPPSLTALHLPYFPLEHAELFHESVPQCVLRIGDVIMLMEPDNGTLLMEKFVSSLELDPNEVANAIDRHYEQLNIRFKLKFSGNRTAFTDRSQIRCESFVYKRKPAVRYRAIEFDPMELASSNFIWTYCSLLSDLSLDIGDATLSQDLRLPLHLLSLDLGSSVITIYPSDLPATLTSISSQGPCRTIPVDPMADRNRNCRPWSCRLVHLDTPLWELDAHHLGPLNELVRFNAQIHRLADYNVVGFLTEAVSPNTRLDMTVDIRFDVTGSLMPKGEDIEVLDLQRIHVYTLQTLEGLLQQSMPPRDSQTPLPADVAINSDRDTIGRVVRTITVGPLYPEFPICIPPSYKSVRIDSPAKCSIMPNLALQAPRGSINPLKAQFPSLVALERDVDLRPSAFGLQPSLENPTPVLVQLILVNVIPRAYWFEALPDTLRLLYLGSYDIFECNGPFPSKLEALILDQPLSAGKTQVFFLGFLLSSLPRTLHSLAIMTSAFELISLEKQLATPLDLPRLDTVYFNIVTQPTMIALSRMLPVAQLKVFQASLILETPPRGNFGSEPDPRVVLKLPPTNLESLISDRLVILPPDTAPNVSSIFARFSEEPKQDEEAPVVLEDVKQVSLTPPPSTTSVTPHNPLTPEKVESSSVVPPPVAPTSEVPSEGVAAPRKKAVRMPRK